MNTCTHSEAPSLTAGLTKHGQVFILGEIIYMATNEDTYLNLSSGVLTYINDGAKVRPLTEVTVKVDQ